MKLKRFLSLFVATIMVLAMVPAMSVSAAGTTGVIDALGGEVLWSCPDGSFNDTAIGTAFSGWSSNITSGYVNVKTYSGVGNVIQYYVNGTENKTTITSPGYGGNGEDAIVIEWVMKRQNPSDLYFDFSFTDKSGTEIAFLKLDRNYTSVSGEYYMGYPAEGTDCAIVATNNGDGTHKVEYYVGGSVVSTVASKAGEIEGFGGITSSNGRWSTAWNHIGFGNLTIGAVTFSATAVDVTATYTVDGTEVATATKSYDPAEGETEAAFAEKYVVYSGDVYYAAATALSENGSVEMTKVDRYTSVPTGTVFMVDGEAYRSTGDSLVVNGNFVTGDMAGWINRNLASDVEGESVAYDAEVGGNAVTISTSGAGATNSIGTKWTVTPGNTYYLSFYVGGTKPGSGNYTYNRVFDGSAELVAYGANMVDGQWTRFEKVFTAANDTILFQGSWASNIKYANVELVPVEVAADQKATTTIKFVSGETELQAAATVTGLIGDVIDLTDATIVPETITYEGNLYSKDAVNKTSHTVETTADEVTITYTTDAVTAITEVPTATVIGTNAPILPTVLKAETGSGAETEVTVTAWNTDELTVGENTVYGTVEGTTLQATATVTVLEETFTLSDVTTVNGQDAGKASQVMFPVAISDEFNMEFTANYASFGDLWITIKTKDAGFFSPEQIPLGVNANGAFRPVNGNGTGGRAVADFDHVTLSTGVNYRFFITTDASTDKYAVTVTNEATGEVVDAFENYGYRTNADAIECITSLTNNGAGSVTLTNIKVNANVEKTEYTFNITLDGETSTTTGSYWSDEEAVASVADIPGYEKAVTVDGTTINVVYSATQTLSATFIDASENVIKEVSEVVAIGETYTVVAEEIFFLDGNYNGYFYQIPETVLSADNNNRVITVSETANKYAVKEDALITGGTEIWGVKAENSNSVFVASAGSASAPTVDANGEKNHNPSHTPSTLGTSRLGFFLFPVVDVADGQKVTANFYVRDWHGNGFSNGNDKLRLTAHAVTDHTWATLTDGDTSYSGPDATLLETWATPVFSEWCYNNVGYIAFDITEMMVAAKEAGMTELTLRLNAPYGAAYIAEREKATVGKAYAGKAAYIAVEDAGLVKVTETGYATLTKNGSEMNGFAYVAATDDVRLVADGAVVIGTDAGYYPVNENLNLTEATTFENTVPAGLGLAMVGGAQVRIGATELEADAKLDALADSGLRFLATADYADTVLADEAVEFGIKVTAEASTADPAYIKAEKFQNEDNNVFSAAITNMKESNYNRKYTAAAYALVPMADGTVEEFTTDSVTRSIYQVSAGIMKNGTADADEAPYTVDGVVKNILNAYVNQTGIRLTYTADGITVEEGKYTGDVFFAVESTVNEDGSVAVTITPDASWGTPAEIASWWTDYVRVNNNNSVAKDYISGAAVDEAGVLTFTFTVPAE